MTDLEHILPLWRELETTASDYVLATLVEVQGSSYRRPGARMLLAPDGRRAGTVSGGCLEAEVAKKAWWLTENGPIVQRYSTLDEDGDLPYGSGCGGVIFILLERRATAHPLLEALHAAWNAREPLAIATVIEGPHIGQRIFAGPRAPTKVPHFAAPQLASWQVDLQRLAQIAFRERKQRDERIDADGIETRVWVDYRTARPGLWIFGAGDDTKPLLNMARQLGWFVAIADGRSHLATTARFPAADRVIPLQISELPSLPSSPDTITPFNVVTLRATRPAAQPDTSNTRDVNRTGAPGLDSETGDSVRGPIQAAVVGHDFSHANDQTHEVEPGAPGLDSETGDTARESTQSALKGHDLSAAGPGTPGLDSETGDTARESTQSALKGHDLSAAGPGAPGLDSETGDTARESTQTALKGHDFSRAESPAETTGALVPEGSLPPDAGAQLDIHPGDAAVLATHSYEQDSHILAFLLGRGPHQYPAYIGILGPQRRTREALRDAANMLDLVPANKLIDQWLEEIHSPTGLDLGADTPASIALSILAEIQKSLTAATALPLRIVRGPKPEIAFSRG